MIARCEYCRQRPRAFHVKHAKTSLHWRCLGCFRALALESPVVVTGVQLPTRMADHDRDLVMVGRAARLLERSATR